MTRMPQPSPRTDQPPAWSARPAVLVGVTTLTMLVGWLQKLPCHLAGWPYRADLIFGRACYSDVPVLYRGRGLADGVFPYASGAGEHPLEYPPLTGLVMDVTARLARASTPGADPAGAARVQVFMVLTVLLLWACAVVAVLATARAGGARAAWLVATAPTLALAGTINWDLVPVALTALAVLAHRRDRYALAGALIGLGAAAKFYPLLLLGPVLVLCLRRRTPRPAVSAVAAAALAWSVVNLPVALAYPDGWAVFWRFNAVRGAEFGSPWYALALLGVHVPHLDLLAGGLFAVACLAVAAFGLAARREPDLALLGFLVVAAFAVTNKVYSPQYVLWLVPLAALAAPGLVDWVAWQGAEVLYWLAVWWFLAGYLVDRPLLYPAAVAVRVLVTGYLAARVTVAAARAPRPAPRALPQSVTTG
jgi:uncharacterized membrane protein